MDIKELLGIDNELLEHRMQLLRDEIPTFSGRGYLEVIAREYSVEPWPFLLYAAYHQPEKLLSIIQGYADYNGNEHVAALQEKLIRYVAIGELLQELQKRG